MSMKSQLCTKLWKNWLGFHLSCAQKKSVLMGSSSRPQCLGGKAIRGGCFIGKLRGKKPSRLEWEQDTVSFFGSWTMPPWTGAAVRQQVMCTAGGASGKQIVITWGGAWPGETALLTLQSNIIPLPSSILLSLFSYIPHSLHVWN